MGELTSLFKRGESELIIEKSRFLGFAERVYTRSEAETFFSEIRMVHKSATHCVPAFVLGGRGEQKWASDDAEPQGTAGLPILRLMEGEGLTYAALMVVRYFGGVKLGTGGLARAYTEAAKEAILDAGKALLTDGIRSEWSSSYAVYDRMGKALSKSGFGAPEPVYGEEVIFSVVCEEERYEELARLINDTSAGGAVLRTKTAELIVRKM